MFPAGMGGRDGLARWCAIDFWVCSFYEYCIVPALINKKPEERARLDFFV